MLGQDLVTVLGRQGQVVSALNHSHLDVADQAAVTAALQEHQPEVVVNCAAWTAVDDAEVHEDEALRVNGHGAANLAAACAASSIRLIQLSTDYVFDGTAERPYAESDVPRPRSAYGRTKLAGEQAVLGMTCGTGYVVRTAWLYGAHGPNFVRTMIRLARQGEEVQVVDDQHGQPTWTIAVAEQVFALILAGAPPGVYHATSSGRTTWFGFAREVFRLLGADPDRVRAVTSRTLSRPAPRPAYSVLGHDAWTQAGIAPIAGWQTVLARAFPELVAAERPNIVADPTD